MKNIRFEIGNRMELTHVKSATGLALGTNKYGSQLLDFDGIRTAKISMPIFENRVVPLAIGDEYQACFFTNSGLYQCRIRVLKRYVENNIHMMDVHILTEPKKYQRRKFYRLDCMFTVKYRLITDVENVLRERLQADNFESPEERANCVRAIDEIPKEWFEGTISDLSGGGIRFHSAKEMPQNTMLEVMLPLSFQRGIVPVRSTLKVIACAYYAGSKIAYEVRGEFENMRDTERETVVKYVFEEQRRRMRKE
ncbi:MAG: flagellar brake protein [Lachnospiraceae bacterium]|nr:flagellar brake protein [Lachnospiraceae bacterium]